MTTFTMKHNGKVLKRSSGETSLYRANKRLEAWKREVAGGNYVPDADKTTFKALSSILLDEYAANGRRATDRVGDAVSHLRAFFGDFSPARSITTDRMLAYVRHRQEEKAVYRRYAIVAESDLREAGTKLAAALSTAPATASLSDNSGDNSVTARKGRSLNA